MLKVNTPIQKALILEKPTPLDFVVTEGTATCVYSQTLLDYTPSNNGMTITKSAHNTTDLTFNFGSKLLITNTFSKCFIMVKIRMPEIPLIECELIIFENGIPIITSPFSNLDLDNFTLFFKDFEANNLNSYNFAFRILQGTTALTTASLTIDEIQVFENYNNAVDFNYKKGGNPTMWIDRTDTTNTPTLTANTDNIQQLQINTEQNSYNDDALNLLDVNGKVTPININDLLSVDFSCTIETPSGVDRYVDVKALIDTDVVKSNTHNLLKGDGVDDILSVSWLIPVKNAFKLNGLRIALNPNSNCVVKNRNICVTRIHQAL